MVTAAVTYRIRFSAEGKEAAKLLRLRDKKQRVMHYPITFIDVAISPNKSGIMIKRTQTKTNYHYFTMLKTIDK